MAGGGIALPAKTLAGRAALDSSGHHVDSWPQRAQIKEGVFHTSSVRNVVLDGEL